MRIILRVALLVGIAGGVVAQPATTVFHGRPIVKVTELGVDRTADVLDGSQAAGFECVVSRIGTTYYWASRQNRVLVLHDGEGYMTFVAEGGKGYVKIVKPQTKASLRSRFSAEQLESVPEGSFDYVEHMPLGLGSVTYFGTASTKSGSQ